MHFDAALPLVIPGLVREVPQHEVAAELAVDAREQVEVERRGDAGGVVVGQQHLGHRLFQVGRQQQRVARLQALADLAQEDIGRRPIKIPDGAPQEQDQQRLARAAP